MNELDSSVNVNARRTSSTRIDELSHMLEHGAQRNLSKLVSTFKYKLPPLLVLQVSRTGEHKLLELEREKILEFAREVVPPVAINSPVSPPPIPSWEQEPELTTRKTTFFRFQNTLQPRDIRLFDPRFANSHDPEVLVRRHAILFNLTPIKSLVLYDKAFIFIPDGADSLLGSFLSRFHEMERENAETPFELRICEVIFMTVTELLEEEFQAMKPSIRSKIKQVLKTTSGVVLEKIRQADANLSALESKVSAVRKALGELLQSDRDMALMALTKVHALPELYVHAMEDHWDFDHEDVELLVEAYLQTIDGTLTSIKSLKDSLDSARSTTALRLSTAQNKLLGVELLVSSVTAVGTYGALVAAVFGMNLESGVEDASNWFWTMFFLVALGTPSLIIIVFYMIKRGGLLIS